MTIYAATVLHEIGIPIYKRFKKGKERPIEPLIAAILGLANEIGLGDIAHASFERAGLIVLRGMYERKLLLSLLVDKVSHQSYVKGAYLLTKIEKNIDSLPDYVTDEIIAKTKDIVDSYFGLLDQIPNIFDQAFISAAEKFGPMFYGSLLIMLYRELGEDPLLTFIKDPRKFVKTLDDLIGVEATNQFFISFAKHICELYPEICIKIELRDIKTFIHKILSKTRKHGRRESIIIFRELLEEGIDAIIHKNI